MFSCLHCSPIRTICRGDPCGRLSESRSRNWAGTKVCLQRGQLAIGAEIKAGHVRRKRERKTCAQTPAPIPLCGIKKRPATFSHPDCTVGPGVAPDPGDFRGLLCLGTTAFPDRSVRSLQISPRGLYRRSGIGKLLRFSPHPAPKVVPIQFSRKCSMDCTEVASWSALPLCRPCPARPRGAGVGGVNTLRAP